MGYSTIIIDLMDLNENNVLYALWLANLRLEVG